MASNSSVDPDSLWFRVVSRRSIPSSGRRLGVLIEDSWDDWGKFQTQFQLLLFDGNSERHELGDVKIGQFGLKAASRAAEAQEGERQPTVPKRFEQLNSSFFSLGQDERYYEVLGKLEPVLRSQVAIALRDVVHDQALWQEALAEEVMGESLLRSVNRTSVEGQFRRLLAGGARLSPYSFAYTYPKRTAGSSPPLELAFRVRPESFPPTNIHVIIGRNGVGKTYTLNLMAKALVGEPASARQSGQFTSHSINPLISRAQNDEAVPFANVVSVSFSAFDEFVAMPEKRDRSEGTQYSYIGLRRIAAKDQETQSPKTPGMLATEFVKSIRLCLMGPRASRWRRALEALEADPMFRESDVAALAKDSDLNTDLEENAKHLFGKLSSGHKIVLLSITRLVETVDEKTLILLDEPEAHLHPPLLSAFVRALSDLLINRNGVAIVATHSPVVLQEVPKDCVWILQRTGGDARAERPEMETFGENLGVLTREVFGLEVARSGFHRMLSETTDSSDSFDEAVARFDEKLGAEARAILRGLFLTRKAGAQ